MKNSGLSTPQVRLFREGDCESLAPRLRLADVHEIELAIGLEPLVALRKSVEVSSKKWSITIDDEVIAIFGVSLRGSTGLPWLVASDGLLKIKRSFLAGCEPYIRSMSEGCDVLTNYVWVQNKVSLKWLAWLGFSFEPPVSYGKSGEQFIRFFKHV